MSSVPASIRDAARALRRERIVDLFAADPERVSRLTFEWERWRIDVSKERLTGDALALLIAHADTCNLAHWIDALCAGEKVNLSEARPALRSSGRSCLR